MQLGRQLNSYSIYLSNARKYCDQCEAPFDGNHRGFLSQKQGLLLELYKHGRALLEIDSLEQDFDNLVERNDTEIRAIIAPKVPFSYYWLTLDPFSIDEPKPGVGDIIDDLGDIYLDLKRSIILHDSGFEGSEKESYWMLKFDFDHHLADHCMNAMSAIHNYMGKDGYNGW